MHLITWISQIYKIHAFSFSFDNEILVHAGLQFKNQDNPLEDEHSKLWIRGWYHDIDHNWLGERKIIHGHTPLSLSEINQMLDQVFLEKVMDIDAGCCYKNVKDLGHLCVLELEQMNIFFQKNIED